MIWIKPSLRLPPQGKKVLWFNKGDCHTVQRFGKHWLPIPFIDSTFCTRENIKAPELWSDICLPGEFTGKVHVCVNGEVVDIDTLEKIDHEFYRNVVNSMLKGYRKMQKERICE